MITALERHNWRIEIRSAGVVIGDNQTAVLDGQRAARASPALNGRGKAVVQCRVKPARLGAQARNLRSHSGIRSGPRRGLVADRRGV
ncbi:hypothetical protein D3C76_668080 [compost metagenome]